MATEMRQFGRERGDTSEQSLPQEMGAALQGEGGSELVGDIQRIQRMALLRAVSGDVVGSPDIVATVLQRYRDSLERNGVRHG